MEPLSACSTQNQQLKTHSPDPGGHIANCEDHPYSETSQRLWKNLGCLNVFSGFPARPRKKKKERKEEGKKKEALQKAKPIAQEHEILKPAVQYVCGSHSRERSKLQLHHLFFTITLITLVISQE